MRYTPAQALAFLKGARVFVTTKERIKSPEGDEMFDEAIAVMTEAAAAPAPVAGDAVDRLLSEFEMLVKHPDTSPIVSTTLTHVVSKMSAALAQDRASQAATADGTAASVLALADSWERGLLSIPRQPGASMIKSAIKDVRAAVAQACRTPTPAAEGEVP